MKFRIKLLKSLLLVYKKMIEQFSLILITFFMDLEYDF